VTKEHPMQNKKLKLKQTISLMENTNKLLLKEINLKQKRRDSVIATLCKRYHKREKEIAKKKQQFEEINNE
jgi:hypothetical protein